MLDELDDGDDVCEADDEELDDKDALDELD